LMAQDFIDRQEKPGCGSSPYRIFLYTHPVSER
jgi:hypothetical protein